MKKQAHPMKQNIPNSYLFSKQIMGSSRLIGLMLGLALTMSTATAQAPPPRINADLHTTTTEIDPRGLPTRVIFSEPGSVGYNIDQDSPCIVGTETSGNWNYPFMARAEQMYLLPIIIRYSDMEEGSATGIAKNNGRYVAVGRMRRSPTSSYVSFVGRKILAHPFGYDASHAAQDVSSNGGVCGWAYIPPSFATWAWYRHGRNGLFYRLFSSEYQGGERSDYVVATVIDYNDDTVYGYEHIGGAPVTSGYVACTWTGTNAVARRLPRVNESDESRVLDADGRVAGGYTQTSPSVPGTATIWVDLTGPIPVPLGDGGTVTGVCESYKGNGDYYLVGNRLSGGPYIITFNVYTRAFRRYYPLNTQLAMGYEHRFWTLLNASGVNRYAQVVGTARHRLDDRDTHAYLLFGPNFGWQ